MVLIGFNRVLIGFNRVFIGFAFVKARQTNGWEAVRLPCNYHAALVQHYLAVLKMIFIFVLGPPLPRGVPGEGPDCHFLRRS